MLNTKSIKYRVLSTLNVVCLLFSTNLKLQSQFNRFVNLIPLASQYFVNFFFIPHTRPAHLYLLYSQIALLSHRTNL